MQSQHVPVADVMTGVALGGFVAFLTCRLTRLIIQDVTETKFVFSSWRRVHNIKGETDVFYVIWRPFTNK